MPVGLAKLYVRYGQAKYLRSTCAEKTVFGNYVGPFMIKIDIGAEGHQIDSLTPGGRQFSFPEQNVCRRSSAAKIQDERI
jgi:hypothetical protein